MKKSLFVAITALTMAGSVAFVSTVKAQETNNQNPFSSLSQKIAEKFNLNQDDVQVVFDEARQDQQDQRAKMETDQLDKLVADGKITEEQKQLIIAKREELQANRESQEDSIKDITDEERKQVFESEQEALKAWAEENGIDPKYLMFGRFGGFRGGPDIDGGKRKPPMFGEYGGLRMRGMNPPAETAN